MTSSIKNFERGGSASSFSTSRGLVGHRSGDGDQLPVYHLLYTFIYIYKSLYSFSRSK